MVVAGLQGTCAITADSVLKCWGLNQFGFTEFGQLGDGTNINRTIPTIVDSGVSYKTISGNALHRCAITTSGVLKCWGWNLRGSVGDGSTLNRSVPVVVDPGTTYSQVSTGFGHTCGITSSGVLKCWGGNSFLGVGNGPVTLGSHHPDVRSPIPVDAGVLYKSVALNSFGSCGITLDGAMKCWGDYTLNSFNYSLLPSVPRVVESGASFSSLVGGRGNTMCAVTSAGPIRCWGKNEWGELGDGTTEERYLPFSTGN